MKRKKIFKFITIYLPIIMLILGIGYANIALDLGASGSVNMLPQDSISIINITPSNLVTNIKTLSVTVKNLGNSKQIFDGLIYDATQSSIYSNSNIIPSLSGITANSTIVNSSGNNDDTITFSLSFGYDDTNNITDNTLDGTINLHFTPLREVTYANCANNNNLTSEYIRSKSFTDMNNNTFLSTVTTDGTQNIKISTSSGTDLIEGTDYTYVNNVVTFLTELTVNIIISNNSRAYFMQYNGLTDLMGFTKTGIKSFQRSDYVKILPFYLVQMLNL